jgi:hypothetical protein
MRSAPKLKRLVIQHAGPKLSGYRASASIKTITPSRLASVSRELMNHTASHTQKAANAKPKVEGKMLMARFYAPRWQAGIGV